MSQGIKHDQGKPDLSQVSYELVSQLARVRMHGEKKYSKYNWRKGFKVTRSISAALRHIFDFLRGYDLDYYPDSCEDCKNNNCQEHSKLSNIIHAVACLEHALYDMQHHPENDDRYKLETDK